MTQLKCVYQASQSRCLFPHEKSQEIDFDAPNTKAEKYFGSKIFTHDSLLVL
jgi:hypothetical protein